MTSLLLSALLAVMPPCATEDAANCAWNATEQGNGVGRSFVDLGGNAYYVN